MSHYQEESGMYCVFFINVLMCTAYTNLANIFLISFLSKNSDLSSFVSHYQEESGMYCVFFYKCFDVYCLHKFSKYIPYKLSIEKQRSFVDA